MSTEPSPPPNAYDARHANRNSRYGLILFGIYVLFYGSFVVLSTFWSELMSKVMPGGVNVAVAYGFALIWVAFLLALVYMFLCRRQGGEESR